jgi:hypothetical protein
VLAANSTVNSRHLIVAHHRGTTIEAKIMLVHAALENLTWVTYVRELHDLGYRDSAPALPQAITRRAGS